MVLVIKYVTYLFTILQNTALMVLQALQEL